MFFRRLLSVLNRSANEEVEPDPKYPKKYKGAKPLSWQMDELHRYFPELSLGPTQKFIDKVLPGLKLPQGAEGWFAIPRWKKIGNTCNKAIERILGAIDSTRKLNNWCEGQLGPDRLCQSERTTKMLDEIGKAQPGDILIVPGQFGMRYRERHEINTLMTFRPNEFEFWFGSFEVGCMLLTHPERLKTSGDLGICCPGDKYDYPKEDQRFNCAPAFNVNAGIINFCGNKWAWWHYGIASGFVPR